MTEPDTSVELAEESPSEQLEDNSQPSVEDFVIETTINKKELSLSLEYDNENPLHQAWNPHRDPTLSSVGGALEEIQEWVEDTNDEEWELDQFRLETTIVAQRTEEEENSPGEVEREIENSLIKE